MKKAFIVLIIGSSLLACGLQTRKDNTSQLLDKTASIHTETSKAKSKDYTTLGFELMERETLGDLKLGLKASDVIRLLGVPSTKSKNEEWDADMEYHQSWQYPYLGIELDMIGKNETAKTIHMITIANPCAFQTSKGISIGSSYKSVRRAYSEAYNPDLSNEDTIVVGSIYGGVVFGFENNLVHYIFIGANAE